MPALERVATLSHPARVRVVTAFGFGAGRTLLATGCGGAGGAKYTKVHIYDLTAIENMASGGDVSWHDICTHDYVAVVVFVFALRVYVTACIYICHFELTEKKKKKKIPVLLLFFVFVYRNKATLPIPSLSLMPTPTATA